MGEVTLDISEGIATVTFDSPETKNAISEAMANRLMELCDAIDADAAVGAAVFQGANDTFCSGAERRQLMSAERAAGAQSPIGAVMYDAFGRVGGLKVPTIAAVQGAAVGAGINLALSTDIRIVATNARLIAGFFRIGIHPGGGFFHLAGRVAGRQAAIGMGVFGEEVSGEDAVRCGLAWAAVEHTEVPVTARALAARAAADPDLARVAVRSARLELGPPALTWAASSEIERGPQAWTLARLQQRG